MLHEYVEFCSHMKDKLEFREKGNVFLSWCFQPSSPLAAPVLGGSKYVLVRYSMKSVVNTQLDVIQALC